MSCPFWSKSNYRECVGRIPDIFLAGHEHPRDAAMVASVLLGLDMPWRRNIECMVGDANAESGLPAVLFAIGMHDCAKFALNFAAQADKGLRCAVINALTTYKVKGSSAGGGPPMLSPESALCQAKGNPRERRQMRAGSICEHHSMTSSFLAKRDTPIIRGMGSERAIKEKPIRSALLQPEDGPGKDGFRRLLAAVGGHHGGPMKPRDFQPVFWVAPAGFEQWNSVAALIECVDLMLGDLDLTREEVMAGFSAVALWPAEAINLILGITIACDWLASDSRYFPLIREPDFYRRGQAIKAGKSIAMGRERLELKEPAELPARLAATARQNPGRGLEKYENITFRGVQEAIQELFSRKVPPPQSGEIIVLEEETGQGKTMAALLLWANLARAGTVSGMSFLVPTRAAAKSLHIELSFVAQNFHHAIDPVLAIPGYLNVGSPTIDLPDDFLLPPGSVRSNLEEWARSMKYRAFAALITIGTIDQLLLAALPVSFGHLRSACVAPNLLVVDEVHASDPYMAVLLEEIIHRHRAAGGVALLMSATLGSELRSKLMGTGVENFPEAPYPALWRADRQGRSIKAPPMPSAADRPQKHFHISFTDAHGVISRALVMAKAGKRVLLIRNTVREAVETVEKIIAEGSDVTIFEPCGKSTAHHARYAPEDRRLLDEAIMHFLKPGLPPTGKIVVSTQTAEQSLDIDADVIITDLCPMDVLLQRLGRCWRKVDARTPGIDRPVGQNRPEVVIIRPDLTQLTSKRKTRVSNIGNPAKAAYDALASAATLAILLDREDDGIKVPLDCRRLVEMAVTPDSAKKYAARIFSAEIVDQFHLWRISNVMLKAEMAKPVQWTAFPDDPEAYGPYENTKDRLGTRLGAKDVLINLIGAKSPFNNKTIAEISIPGFLWEGGVIPTEPITVLATSEGFSFKAGGKEWRYDKFGLQLQSQ